MNEKLRKKMEWRLGQESIYETDKGFIKAMMRILPGQAMPDIEKWEKEHDEEFYKKLDAVGDCPEGSLAIWGEEEMLEKRIAVPMIIAMFATNTFAGGFTLRGQNDFGGSGDHYTHGVELLWLDDARLTENSVVWEAYGFRHFGYTPDDVTASELQPDERPWAGLSAGVYERWLRKRREYHRHELMVGLVGDWSGSEGIHKNIFGGREPRGWDNQVPSEPVVNYNIEVYKPLWIVGHRDGFCADVTQTTGASVGTAFVNIDFGGFARIGWAVPPEYRATLIQPSFVAPRWYGYLHIGAQGQVVVHNVTIGGSLFQEGPERTLKPFVADAKVGATVGAKDVLGMDVGLSYSRVHRSAEFSGQGRPVDYGAVALSIMKGF